MQLMHERDILHKYATKSNLAADWENYKATRNKINILIRQHKKSYFTKNILTSSSKRQSMEVSEACPSK